MKCWEQLYYSLFVPSWRCPATSPSSSCHWCCGQWQSGTLQTTPPWPSSATQSSRQRAVIAITGMAYSTASNTSVGEENPAGVPRWPLWTAVSLVTLSDSLSLSLASLVLQHRVQYSQDALHLTPCRLHCQGRASISSKHLQLWR